MGPPTARPSADDVARVQEAAEAFASQLRDAGFDIDTPVIRARQPKAAEDVAAASMGAGASAIWPGVTGKGEEDASKYSRADREDEEDEEETTASDDGSGRRGVEADDDRKDRARGGDAEGDDLRQRGARVKMGPAPVAAVIGEGRGKGATTIFRKTNVRVHGDAAATAAANPAAVVPRDSADAGRRMSEPPESALRHARQKSVAEMDRDTFYRLARESPGARAFGVAGADERPPFADEGEVARGGSDSSAGMELLHREPSDLGRAPAQASAAHGGGSRVNDTGSLPDDGIPPAARRGGRGKAPAARGGDMNAPRGDRKRRPETSLAAAAAVGTANVATGMVTISSSTAVSSAAGSSASPDPSEELCPSNEALERAGRKSNKTNFLGLRGRSPEPVTGLGREKKSPMQRLFRLGRQRGDEVPAIAADAEDSNVAAGDERRARVPVKETIPEKVRPRNVVETEIERQLRRQREKLEARERMITSPPRPPATALGAESRAQVANQTPRPLKTAGAAAAGTVATAAATAGAVAAARSGPSERGVRTEEDERRAQERRERRLARRKQREARKRVEFEDARAEAAPQGQLEPAGRERRLAGEERTAEESHATAEAGPVAAAAARSEGQAYAADLLQADTCERASAAHSNEEMAEARRVRTASRKSKRRDAESAAKETESKAEEAARASAARSEPSAPMGDALVPIVDAPAGSHLNGLEGVPADAAARGRTAAVAVADGGRRTRHGNRREPGDLARAVVSAATGGDAPDVRAIDESMREILQQNPESFRPPPLLYIGVSVNGVPLGAVLDTAAQASFITLPAARRAGLQRLVDSRFAAGASGNATTSGGIVGRIHICPLAVGATMVQCSLAVSEGGPKGRATKTPDVVLGADVLLKTEAILDLKRQRLVLGHDKTPIQLDVM
jgi:hypothetical protein